MTSAIGWYGPLINLSDAPANIGCFVQLVVAVHRSTPVQYKLPKGGDVIRTDFRVGDDTRPQFGVSIWQKHLMSSAVPGDVILLQNVKIVKFGDGVEARTSHCSSVVRLVHSHELFSGEVEELLQKCKVGIAAKDKLKKVIEWVKKTNGSSHLKKQQLSRNWKMQEVECRGCSSLAEVLHLRSSCKATFHASIGEIFLPLHSRSACEVEKEKMFISCRVNNTDGTCLAEDFVCAGCQLCGSPLGPECSEPTAKHGPGPLYCDKSPNRLHVIGLIYRPFLLYIWDDTDCLPLLVRNKAAEILFGNIRADRVHECVKGNLPRCKFGFRSLAQEHSDRHRPPNGESTGNKCKSPPNGDIDLHYVWVIMLKALLQPQKNSPLKFEVTMNNSMNKEEERLEMVNHIVIYKLKYMDYVIVDEEAIIHTSILTSSFTVPMVLNATIELAVLEIIRGADSGISANEIASSLSPRNPGAASMLDRMLRLLASHSILTCSSRTTLDDHQRTTTERLYRLTPIGKLFAKDSEGGSLARFLTFSQHLAILNIRKYLKDAVLEGGIPFKMAHGTSAFQYMKTDPVLNRAFNSAVSSHSTMVTRHILNAYSGFVGLETLVDVGGGRGTTLHMIVSKYPCIKGINFDLPQVISDAPTVEGIEHVSGNMFKDEIPRGDAILLKRVCHNWGDDKCLKILRKCHEALPRGGKLIMIESILMETPDSSPESKYVSQFDNLMFAQHQGKERTQSEFAELGKGSGFTSFKIVCCACAHWVMEFTKV